MSVDRVHNIVHGPPEPKNVNNNTNSLAEFLYQRLSTYPERVVLVNGLDSGELTSIELRDQAIRVASCLRMLGVTDLDKVGFIAENRLELAIVICGTILLGATAVPLNSAYTPREIHHAMQIAKPSVVFGSECVVGKIEEAVSQQSLSTRPTIIIFDEPTQGKHEKYITYQRFVSNPYVLTNPRAFSTKRQHAFDKVAILLYSSGTTGLPKAVQLTEHNVMMSIAHSEELTDDEEFNETLPDPLLLTVGPWSHTFGCLVLLASVSCLRRLIFLPKFVDRHYLAAIQKYQINLLHVVPPLMVFLAKSPLVDEYDLSSVRAIGCGAAPLTKELEEAVRQRLGIAIIVRQGYGMTEATLIITQQTGKFRKAGSIGTLVSGFSGRVVDVESGKNVGANQRGELHFRGSKIMKGYAGDAVATNATIDSEGWLHTGDIGYYDDDGEWFIVDRLKELIKYNGFQVPPAEIEGLLLQHPLISDAGVIGIPDERFGELPMAFVVKQADGQRLTEHEVIQFVANRTSRPKQLHGGVRFVDGIPKNPSGKILRRELRGMRAKIAAKL